VSDLDQQLRAYFDVLADEVEANVISRHDPSEAYLADGDGPTTPDSLATTAQGSEEDFTVLDLREDRESQHEGPVRRKRWAVLAAAAAAVLLVAGLVVADNNNGTVVTGSVSSTATSHLSDSGPPASVVDSLGHLWSRVPHDEASFGGARDQTMSSVTAWGPGLVAVGFEWLLGFEEADAAVWTSPDGHSWVRVPHDEAVFGGDRSAEMLGVTAGGPGLVAVGSNLDDGTDDLDAAVWTSVDGISWSRVPHDNAVFGGPGLQQMTDVVVGGPGLVAVGWDGDQYAGTAVGRCGRRLMGSVGPECPTTKRFSVAPETRR
jgi:hypothetical protein